MEQRVTDYLGQEHQELSHLLNQLQEQLRVLPLARDYQGTGERLTGITRAIARALHEHFIEEEQVLYPVLEGHVEGLTATLDRMRHEHDTGAETERAFQKSLEGMTKNGRNRAEVMQRGRQYILWLRNYLLDENGRLFPMVERGLDPETQETVRQAMEKLGQESPARIAEVRPAEA